MRQIAGLASLGSETACVVSRGARSHMRSQGSPGTPTYGASARRGPHGLGACAHFVPRAPSCGFGPHAFAALYSVSRAGGARTHPQRGKRAHEGQPMGPSSFSWGSRTTTYSLVTTAASSVTDTMVTISDALTRRGLPWPMIGRIDGGFMWVYRRSSSPLRWMGVFRRMAR